METSSHATRQGTLVHCQFAEPLWTDPDLKSGFGVRESVSTTKNKNLKNAHAENESLRLPPKFSHARKKPPLLEKGGSGGGRSPSQLSVGHIKGKGRVWGRKLHNSFACTS